MRGRFRGWAPSAYARHGTVWLLTVGLVLATTPRGWALERVLGTVQGKGPVYAATATTDWTGIVSTRPLVGGDRLKTETGGNLLADFGHLGVVGLYENTEVAVRQNGTEVLVDVRRGKAAFHMERSGLSVTAHGAVITGGTVTAATADGYVELDQKGQAHVTVEGDSLNVSLPDGSTRTLARGERLALSARPAAAAEEEDERKAGPVAALPEKASRKPRGGLSAREWTAVAGVVAAVAIGVGVGVGTSDGDGDDGDSNGSE